jgi:hypothetical protein
MCELIKRRERHNHDNPSPTVYLLLMLQHYGLMEIKGMFWEGLGDRLM